MDANSTSPRDAQVHCRRSIHLAHYDYRTAGAYFVTLCAADRAGPFGTVSGDQMHLAPLGHLVGECWVWLAGQYPYVELDAWTLMPNHLHGIVVIVSRIANAAAAVPARKPLGRLIGAFKTVSTRRVNELRSTPGAVLWQRDYFEHVVRSEGEMERIRQYIADNALRWSLDRENPSRVPR